MKTKSIRSKKRARTGRSLWIPLILATGVTAAASTDSITDPLDGTRAVLEQWVQTRRLISQEKRDWAEGRQLLEERIELVEREIESLRERTAEARAGIDTADKQRAQLAAEDETLEETSDALAETIAGLEGRAKAILKRMPDQILGRVKSLTQRIPQDPTTTKSGLSDRYLNIVGILNEVDRFNREITLASEVRELPNGTAAEVAVMYVGLGQAYYVTNNGESAGIGTAGAEGWIWKPADEAAANITKAIAILRNEEVAEYVPLPIQILSGAREVRK